MTERRHVEHLHLKKVFGKGEGKRQIKKDTKPEAKKGPKSPLKAGPRRTKGTLTTTITSPRAIFVTQT